MSAKVLLVKLDKIASWDNKRSHAFLYWHRIAIEQRTCAVGGGPVSEGKKQNKTTVSVFIRDKQRGRGREKETERDREHQKERHNPTLFSCNPTFTLQSFHFVAIIS